MTIELVLLPLIAAFTGWVTNLVAIRMLFHPRHEWRILGLRIQGILPKRQPDLARKVGQVVG